MVKADFNGAVAIARHFNIGSKGKGVSQREIPMRVMTNRVRWVGIAMAATLAGVVGGCSFYEGAVPPSEQTAMAPSPGPCPYGESAMYCYGNPAQPYFTGPGGNDY